MSKGNDVIRALVEALQPQLQSRASQELTLSGSKNFIAEFGNIFGLCADGDITTLFYQGNEPLLDWMGVRKARALTETHNYVAWSAPAGYATGTYARGIPTSWCETGAGYEWMHCDFTLNGFGGIVRTAPVRENGGQNLPLCVTSPMYRVDGVQIDNQDDWDLAHLLNAVMVDLSAGLLVGSRQSNANFDHNGLNQLIKTGYTNSDGTECPLMDSTIIDWAGLSVCGNEIPTGEDPVPTLNGTAFPTFTDAKFYNLYYVIRSIIHRNKQRLRRAQMRQPVYGDVAIAAPEELHMCIVECAVCWIECAGDYTRLDSEAAAARRRDFMNGRGGFMEIEVDGLRIPLVPYNPLGTGDAGDPTTGEMNNADGTSNMFILFRGTGGRRVMYVQYPDLSDGTLPTQANGQFQIAQTEDQYCIQTSLRTKWRLYLDAPWLQTKIENVSCESLFGGLFALPEWLDENPDNMYNA